MTSSSRTSYDEVPYESYSFPQTHPDRLATMATLLGLRPAAPHGCRVLELGCAAGGNLIPMAFGLPGSSFVGIDLSRVQVEDGRETIKALQLTNIELRQLSILDVGDDFGKFDYVICHGVYSWVPAPVQEKILEICRNNLTAQGVAYVSYNTYPGWHMRGMIRDMLFYHAKQFLEPGMRVRQARNLLDFLAKAAAKDTGAFGVLLRSELDSFRRSSDSYLYHEHLEEINEPVYFHEFVERAGAKGLKYLGEVDLRAMVPSNYPPEIENVLQMLAQDHVHMEQYMDFLRNRMFRQTLLCHRQHTPLYALRGEQLRHFQIASPARLRAQDSAGMPPNFALDKPLAFETPSGLTLQAGEPIVKAAMVVLAEAWPKALAFAGLLREARARLQATNSEEDDAQALGRALLSFYAQASTSLVELWLEPPLALATSSGTKPTASRLARHQALRQDRVTNLRHESVALGDFERRLLALLDGTRDRDALVQEIEALVVAGELTVSRDGAKLQNRDELRAVLRQAIDAQLPILASNGLLTS